MDIRATHCLVPIPEICDIRIVAAKVGHHKITFLVAGDALGRAAKNHLGYFDLCRRKRNKVDYDLAGVATDKDVAELIKKVMEFKTRCGVS